MIDFVRVIDVQHPSYDFFTVKVEIPLPHSITTEMTIEIPRKHLEKLMIELKGWPEG